MLKYQINDSMSIKKIVNEAELCVNLHLYFFEADVKSDSHENFQLFEEEVNKVINESDIEERITRLKNTHKYLKSIGGKPSRYAHSGQALYKRILQGKKITRINNIIDFINFISIKTFCPVGVYDLDKVVSDTIIIDKGTKLTNYETIGNRIIKLQGVPILKDVKGAFGSIISDSIRCSITEKTRKMMMIIYDFGEQPFSKYLQEEIDETIFNSFNNNVKKQNFYYEK